MDFLESNQKDIQSINHFLNEANTKRLIIKRLLFSGEYSLIPEVDFIYYGNSSNGIWCSKEEIIEYLINYPIYSSTIHISKLYYQSLHRNLKLELGYEFRRYYVQFKWYSIEEDLKAIIAKKRK